MRPGPPCHSLNEQPTVVNSASLAIVRTSRVAGAAGPYLASYTYRESCGWFSTCTATRREYHGGGIAKSADLWVYEFELQGTGPEAVPSTTVPEPGSLALFAAGLAGLIAVRRKHQA